MIRHIAMFTFSAASTPEQRQAVVDDLRKLPGLIPTIRGYEVATTLGLVEGAADLAVVGLFDDEAGWRAYIDHPEHRRVADTMLAPIRVERLSFQQSYPAE